MSNASEELTAAVASIVARHHAYDTAQVISAVAEKLTRLPGRSALEGPTKRHAWPAFLSHHLPGTPHVSFDRRWIADEVREARRAM